MFNASSPTHSFTSAPYRPFYYVPRESLIPGLDDNVLSIAAPFVIYWAASLLFHVIDISKLPMFEKHRIHEPEEITKRNKVSMKDVVWAVLLQQLIQSAMGLYWLGDSDPQKEVFRNFEADLSIYRHWVAKAAFFLLGQQQATRLMVFKGQQITEFVYWWAVPILQFLFASFVLDTWQYFLHRLFHVNKFLYRTIHSVHHRLYVPYAFGALYNHPLEGFFFDTLGAVVAEACALMSTRQAILLFTISTLKTVDDHCGFALPYDPLQRLFGNNVKYHDIHHQQFGIKKNFSQPYFTHWDAILGTRMTEAEVPAKYRRNYDESLRVKKVD